MLLAGTAIAAPLTTVLLLTRRLPTTGITDTNCVIMSSSTNNSNINNDASPPTSSKVDTSTPSVLPVAGVWEREWEEDPLGCGDDQFDRSTLVLWTQSTSTSSKSGSNDGYDAGDDNENGGRTGRLAGAAAYVDLRLPEGSPGRSAESARLLGLHPRPAALAAAGFDLDGNRRIVAQSDQAFDAVLRQKSFAGVLEYKDGDTTGSGDALKKDKVLAALASTAASSSSPSPSLRLCTCFWRRDLDYQPPSGGLDIGVCAPYNDDVGCDGSSLSSSSSRERLRETGYDGSYAEGWARMSGTERGPFAALRLVSENGVVDARRGYWVRAGNRFAYAVGRPQNVDAARELSVPEKSALVAGCVGKVLSEAVADMLGSGGKNTTGDRERALDVVASYVAVAGEVAEETGTWKILQSTNPELVGCFLVGDDNGSRPELCCSHLAAGTVSVGQEIDQILSPSVVPGTDAPTAAAVTRRWKVLELNGCSLPL